MLCPPTNNGPGRPQVASNGWMLSAAPIRAPWDLAGKAVDDPASAFKFELYDVSKDWSQKMERTVPLILPVDETFDVGSKTGTPIDDRDYQVPFRFTGKINKVTIAVEPPKMTAEDEKKLADANRAAQDAK